MNEKQMKMKMKTASNGVRGKCVMYVLVMRVCNIIPSQLFIENTFGMNHTVSIGYFEMRYANSHWRNCGGVTEHSILFTQLYFFRSRETALQSSKLLNSCNAKALRSVLNNKQNRTDQTLLIHFRTHDVFLELIEKWMVMGILTFCKCQF